MYPEVRQESYVRDAYQMIDDFNKTPKTAKEFDGVREALASIIEPQKEHYVPENLKGRVEALKRHIDSAEQIFQEDSDYLPAQGKVLQKISERVEKLGNLNAEQKAKIAELNVESNKIQKDMDNMQKHWTTDPRTIEIHDRREKLADDMDKLKASGNNDKSSPEWKALFEEREAIRKLEQEEWDDGVNAAKEVWNSIVDSMNSFSRKLFG